MEEFSIIMALEPVTTMAIAGAAASLIGGLFSSASNKHATKENLKMQHGFDLENMSIANQYNIDAFNRENSYNTPLQQRIRMEEAGLNPNWIDGGTSVAASQDTGLFGSSASPGPNQGIDFQAAVNAGLQAFGMETQRKESAARIDKLNTEIADLKSQIRKRDGVDTSVTEAQTKEMIASAEQKAKDAKLKQKEIDSFEQKLDAYISNIKSSTELNNIAADAQAQKLPKEVEEIISKVAKNKADAQKALNDIAMAKIAAANDTQRTKNDTNRVAIENRRQRSDEYHQRQEEAIGRAGIALQRMVNDSSIKYMDAQTYEKRLQNVVDYELWLDNVPQETAKAALREFNEKVRRLKQDYRTNQVKEEFNQWMLKQLINTNDWESIQLQKIFHSSPFE